MKKLFGSIYQPPSLLSFDKFHTKAFHSRIKDKLLAITHDLKLKKFIQSKFPFYHRDFPLYWSKIEFSFFSWVFSHLETLKNNLFILHFISYSNGGEGERIFSSTLRKRRELFLTSRDLVCEWKRDGAETNAGIINCQSLFSFQRIECFRQKRVPSI